MNVTANSARSFHQKYITDTPPQPETPSSHTPSIRPSRVKFISHFLVDEFEETDALTYEPAQDTDYWLNSAAIAPEQHMMDTTNALLSQPGLDKRTMWLTIPTLQADFGEVINPHLPTLPVHNPQDLHDALADMDSLHEEARQDDLPEPDAGAVENARILLPKLFAIYPARYQVSPTERRGVAIDAPMRWGASVAVECAPDDTVYCFAAIDGNSRRAKFYQMDGLPDVFIEKALCDLAAG